MASRLFLEAVDGLSDFDGGVIYNVDNSVGDGCLNVRDDVMLVQYLFDLLSRDRDWDDFTSALPAIKVDGYWGPITRKWVVAFQSLVDKTLPSSIFMDYRVDPSSSTGITSLTHSIYTIVYLNLAVIESNPIRHQNLPTDPLTPTLLRVSLAAPDPAPPGPNPLPPPLPPPIGS